MALKRSFGLWLLIALVALVLAKTAGTSISLAGGFGGGIFSPWLVVSAMVGVAFGIVVMNFFPVLFVRQGGLFTRRCGGADDGAPRLPGRARKGAGDCARARGLIMQLDTYFILYLVVAVLIL